MAGFVCTHMSFALPAVDQGSRTCRPRLPSAVDHDSRVYGPALPAGLRLVDALPFDINSLSHTSRLLRRM